MKIEIDKNNLLTIFNENIPQTKEYTYSTSGYLFSDFDKGIIILHKKERKIINLKNLGDNMNVVYVAQDIQRDTNQDGVYTAMKLFQWFDEDTGKTYSFIPGLWESQQNEKNTILTSLWIDCTIHKTARGMIIEGIKEKKENIWGYIFGLMIIYGKFEEKNKELNSIKIQIPLFWQYMKYEEELDTMIQILQNQWIFLKGDKISNKNGITYQISSNDYELLDIVTKWYEPVEKFKKITKLEFTQEMKKKLIDFISTNPEIPQEGKTEVLKQIKEWTIKLLTK